MKNERVCLITNMITPYRISLFNHLAKITELKVIFLAESEKDREWKVYWDEIEFDYKVLKGGSLLIKRFEAPLYFNFGLFKELRRYSPDSVVICGYHYFATWLAVLYARIYKRKIILWAGSHLRSGFLKNRFTDLYKRMIIPRFDSYVTYGTAAKEQIVHYGADPRKVTIGCNTVDTSFFISGSKAIGAREKKKFKSSFSGQNILYVGGFIPRKGVMQLIKAFELLRSEIDDVGLILVGDGPEKESYQRYINENNIKDVYFPGFVQKEEIIKYFLVSDCFVLPSSNEVWGLVVNEAMACGVPTVVSKYCGSSYDLINDGENGFVIDPDDIPTFKERLKEIVSDSHLRKSFSEKSLELISEKGVEQYADNILEAVNAAS